MQITTFKDMYIAELQESPTWKSSLGRRFC